MVRPAGKRKLVSHSPGLALRQRRTAVAAPCLQFLGRFHEFRDSLGAQEARGEQHRRLPLTLFRRDRSETAGIDARAADKNGFFLSYDSFTDEHFEIAQVLDDHSAIGQRTARSQAETHECPEQPRAPRRFGEDMTEPVERVDNRGAASRLRRDRTVDHAFYGDVVDEVGLFAPTAPPRWSRHEAAPSRRP